MMLCTFLAIILSMATLLEQPSVNGEAGTALPAAAMPARPKRLDWATWLPFVGALALLATLTRPLLQDWYWEWTAPESYYAHAPLIPVIVALMFWHRREGLKSVPKAPCWGALLVLVPSLALYVFASKSFALALMSLSFLLVVWSGVWATLGTKFVRAFWFPLGFLLLMAPLPGPLLNDATLRLQMTSTAFADKILHAMLFNTTLQGNVIQMDNFSLFIDVPCSGFKLLLSLLTFSAAFAYLVDGTRKRRIALLILSVPLALLVNSVRIALIGVVGECVGAPAAHVFHDWSGILTLVLGFTALFSVAKGFGCRTFAGWAIF